MADYEREEAREWQLSTGGRLPSSRRKVVPFYTTRRRDNAATTAWRKNANPDATFRLPKNFEPEAQIQAKDKIHGRVDYPILQKIERISEDTRTRIELASYQSDQGLTLKIWGVSDCIKVAQQKLRDWINEFPPQQENRAGWAHIPSLNPKQKAIREKDYRAETERQKFKRAPPMGIVYGGEGTFEWPADVQRPEEVLGNSLEELDPIRMEHHCYISYDTTTNIIKVTGNNPSNVQKALSKVRGTYFEIVARGIETSTRYLLAPLTGNPDGVYVKLIPYGKNTARSTGPLDAKTSRIAKFTPQICGTEVGTDEHSRSYGVAEAATQRNSTIMEHAISVSLHNLCYYRGHIKMRARLGTFLLTRDRNPALQTLAQFETMMKDSQIIGEVTQEYVYQIYPITQSLLGNKALEDQLQTRLKDEVPVFDLSEQKAVYMGTFTVKGSRDVGTLQLEVQYQEDKNGHVDCLSRKWVRTISGGDLHQVLNVSLIDLDSSLAWQFDITAGPIIDDTKHPAFSQFAKSVAFDFKITAGSRPSSTSRFLWYQPTHGLELLSMQQKKAWHVPMSLYTIEIAKIQNFTPNISTVPGTYPELVANEPRWMVSVYGTEWAATFEQNANLRTGEGTSWKPDMQKFFPVPDDSFPKTHKSAGFPHFLDVLEKVRKLVQGESL